MTQQTKIDEKDPDGSLAKDGQGNADGRAAAPVAESTPESSGTPSPGRPTDQPPQPNQGADTISHFHANKLDERRYDWIVDWRLIGFTAVGLLGLLVVITGSYYYNSSRTPATLLNRADQAAADGNHPFAA